MRAVDVTPCTIPPWENPILTMAPDWAEALLVLVAMLFHSVRLGQMHRNDGNTQEQDDCVGIMTDAQS